MKKTMFWAVLALLAGCAKQPGDIVAASVPTDSYMQMGCQNLVAEKNSKQAELDTLSLQQQKTAERDAAWVAIVHVPVASMASGDQAARISTLKGEVNAIEQAQNVCRTTIVQDAWRRGQPLAVHAWIYGLQDGLIRDLRFGVTAAEEVGGRYEDAISAFFEAPKRFVALILSAIAVDPGRLHTRRAQFARQTVGAVLCSREDQK